MTDPRLRKVLIVEDELLVALLIEDYLHELGYEVLGPAMRLERALAFAREETFDFAVLDINLAGQQSFPVADVLRERAIPFVFVSGYGKAGLSESYAGAAILQKPFEIRDLEMAMSGV